MLIFALVLRSTFLALAHEPKPSTEVIELDDLQSKPRGKINGDFNDD